VAGEVTAYGRGLRDRDVGSPTGVGHRPPRPPGGRAGTCTANVGHRDVGGSGHLLRGLHPLSVRRPVGHARPRRDGRPDASRRHRAHHDANAATGEDGHRNTAAAPGTVARLLEDEDDQHLSASTRVIGRPYPMKRERAGLSRLLP
jgi:hypothetical protein